MSIQQAAQAVQLFADTTATTPHGSLPLRQVMLAISGSESGWDPTADGDCGLGGPACGTCSGTWGAATSWGLWQIHNVHSGYLTQQTGSTDPCLWRTWLFHPQNNAIAALYIYQHQGLDAWTTYQNGAWAQHLGAAQEALAALTASGGTAVTSPALPLTMTPVAPSHLGLVAVGVGIVLGGLTIAALETDLHWKQLRTWFTRQRR